MTIRVRTLGSFAAGAGRALGDPMEEVLLLRGLGRAHRLGAGPDHEVLLLREFGAERGANIPVYNPRAPQQSAGGTATTQMISPVMFRRSGLRVGEFMFNASGGTISTTVARFHRQAPEQAADVFAQIQRVSAKACETTGVDTSAQLMCMKATWGPYTVPTSELHRGVLNGDVPIYRARHPNGEAWGVYVNVARDRDVDGAFPISFTFKKRPSSLFGWLWDELKELIVDIIKFVGSAIRDLIKSIVCSQAKSLMTQLADVADGKRTLSGGNSWIVTFKANGVETSETVEASDAFAAKAAAVQPYPGAIITEIEAKQASLREVAISAGIGSYQLDAIVSGGVEAAGLAGIIGVVTDRFCGAPPPPPPPPEASSGLGVTIAVVAGAAGLLYYLFR